MGEIVEPNTCIRGCCTSDTIPLHLHPSSFSLISPIAKGSESVVYDARLDGRRVAAKKPILSTSDDLDKFHKELQLLCKLDHPRLATLIAAHARPPNYMFFFQFYEGRNLAEKLHVEEWNPSIGVALEIAFQLAHYLNPAFQYTRRIELSEADEVYIGLLNAIQRMLPELAKQGQTIRDQKALQYLHNLGIAHRDVKPANILLDENLQPHLADFGLAAYKKDLKQISLENWRSGKPTGGFHKKNMVGTLIYMAPEILRRDIHTEKSDVYSFAVSINELLTGVVPYTDLRAEAQAHTVLEMNYTEQQLTAAVVSEELRPVLAGPESGAPSNVLSLIQRCWDAIPQQRPSFDDIVEELRLVMKGVKKLEEAENVTEKPPISLSDQHPADIINLPDYQENINWFTQGEQLSKRSSLIAMPSMRVWPDFSHDPLVYHPTLSWGSFATCGRRETMEDTHFLLPQMCNENDIYVFGIFDGHRGAAAAEFSARALPGFLQTLSSTSSPSDALSEAFLKTDVAFRNQLESFRNSRKVIQKDCHPGCTAIVALVVKNKLFVANSGDCRTIICRGGHPFALSKDHVASCREERDRVIRAGMQVKWQVDTWRVGPAALQVTRSIGDDDLKPAVTAEPEITETSLLLEDEYLVMASDGLWDVLSNEEVVSFIRDTIKEAGMCSKRLATEAAERGSKDNITVIVVFLRPVSTAERIY